MPGLCFTVENQKVSKKKGEMGLPIPIPPFVSQHPVLNDRFSSVQTVTDGVGARF
jgi:hypothetical protein